KNSSRPGSTPKTTGQPNSNDDSSSTPTPPDAQDQGEPQDSTTPAPDSDDSGTPNVVPGIDESLVKVRREIARLRAILEQAERSGDAQAIAAARTALQLARDVEFLLLKRR